MKNSFKFLRKVASQFINIIFHYWSDMVLGDLLLTGDIIINTLRKCAVCTPNYLGNYKKRTYNIW